MSNNKEASSGGIGVCGLLGVLFVALKLLGITAVAEWSWWWVTCPFWIGIALVLVILLGVGIAVTIAAAWDKLTK
jgi:membrane protein YdbS with pleckstrin-like domain